MLVHMRPLHNPDMHRPTLGVLDLSDGPSGLSRYLEMLWPALTTEYRVVVFGDPRGPYASWPGCQFVPLPEQLWHQSWKAATANEDSSTLPTQRNRFNLRSAYRRLAPRWARRTIGFVRDAKLIAGVLHSHCVDTVYLPLCDLECTPLAAWMAGIRGRVGVFHHLPPTHPSRSVRYATRASLNLLTSVIAVSEGAGSSWGHYLPTIRPKIVVVPNGIVINDPDVPDHPRAEVLAKHGLPTTDRPIWLAAGRLAPAKGFSHLVDAVAQLRNRHPNLLVAIAGEGPLHAELTAQISRLELSGNVTLLGQIRGLDSLFRVADGFVLSSVSEAMPYVLLEAMSHGLPVVATAVGGVPELVQNGKNGILCSPGSPEQLAAGIDHCLTQPEAARAMAQAGRIRVRDSYSVEAMRASTVTVFRAAASGARVKRQPDLLSTGGVTPW